MSVRSKLLLYYATELSGHSLSHSNPYTAKLCVFVCVCVCVSVVCVLSVVCACLWKIDLKTCML